MTNPKIEELNESIEELTKYYERLYNEILMIAQKLKMPKSKIESTLKEHTELSQIKDVISTLIKQRDNQNII